MSMRRVLQRWLCPSVGLGIAIALALVIVIVPGSRLPRSKPNPALPAGFLMIARRRCLVSPSKVTSKSTGAVRTAITGGDGTYTVTNLGPGALHG